MHNWKQKRLGIVGGIGPESTIEYYRLVLSAYAESRGDGSAAAIVIHSIDVRKMLGLIATDRQSTVEYLLDALDVLAAAGAELAILGANTPHIVFDELQRRCKIPLLSIVEATRDHARALGFRRVGLLGTRFTMQATFYPAVFAASNIAVVTPSTEEQEIVHKKYVGELLNNIFLPETRTAMVAVIEHMKRRDGIEGVILGGTELPLLLKDEQVAGLPLLDTTRIHARAAVARLIEMEQAAANEE